MKSTKEDIPANPAVEYPCLMIANEGKSCEVIVFFTQVDVGTVVYRAHGSIWSLGEHSSMFNTSSFTPFTGRVILDGAE